MTNKQLFKRIGIGGVGVVVVGFLAVLLFRIWNPGSDVWTNDAYVTADYTTIAPQVSGLISQVLVNDNEHVSAGQVLATIDDRNYVVAVKSAQANVSAAEAAIAHLDAEITRQPMLVAQAEAAVQADDASLAFAQANARRYRNLSQNGAAPIEQEQQSNSTLGALTAARAGHMAAVEAAQQDLEILKAQRSQAIASLEQARAGLEQAQLNLSYTRVVAPEEGVVGARAVRVGAYVGPGTALLALVPLQKVYINADYLEVDLAHVRPGQAVSIRVDTFPGITLYGTVNSIAPATGLTFAPIAPDNATGNFTKVVQRLAVKILLNPGQKLVGRLRVGMTVETTIHTGGDTITSNGNPSLPSGAIQSVAETATSSTTGKR
jgi:membrane fusion protein, multidrug efflux system